MQCGSNAEVPFLNAAEAGLRRAPALLNRPTVLWRPESQREYHRPTGESSPRVEATAFIT
jgi:hypothetical protein